MRLKTYNRKYGAKMNVKMIEVKVDEDFLADNQSPYVYDNLEDMNWYIPLIEIGSRVHIFYTDCLYIRLITTPVISHYVNKCTRIHNIETENSIIKFKEIDYINKRKRQFNSKVYFESSFERRWENQYICPEGYLFSNGIYSTKIHPSDLPLWYVYGLLYRHFGYISAKGVKSMIYVPNYYLDHLYKYDTLFISYDKEIIKEESNGMVHYKNYTHALSGNIIVPFVKTAECYSKIDVNHIKDELLKKEHWYWEMKGTENDK